MHIDKRVQWETLFCAVWVFSTWMHLSLTWSGQAFQDLPSICARSPVIETSGEERDTLSINTQPRPSPQSSSVACRRSFKSRKGRGVRPPGCRRADDGLCKNWNPQWLFPPEVMDTPALLADKVLGWSWELLSEARGVGLHFKGHVTTHCCSLTRLIKTKLLLSWTREALVLLWAQFSEQPSSSGIYVKVKILARKEEGGGVHFMSASFSLPKPKTAFSWIMFWVELNGCLRDTLACVPTSYRRCHSQIEWLQWDTFIHFLSPLCLLSPS